MIAETSECIILGTRFFVFIFFIFTYIHIIYIVYLPFYDRWFSNGFLTSPVLFFYSTHYITTPVHMSNNYYCVFDNASYR